ncbi:type II toxin-antitoxin system YafQ family toxin [Lactobacillus sp. ESL0679]|uniref:type II toxin-antitoxin system YafQ family toxin n=1 Tax=Lactobacillus sp. ESL0679 TaxID=2983209 RepID=UPI0023F98ADB|nr:type II toxin-antitoxin system YafQ family toxin [Lactobacillus sp. ESL0679]MDF7682286.1 type II toxin-antitoxin system YafQ family toxin [Lactobacillus sp. ESL0679]
MSNSVYKPAFESQFKKHYKKMLKGGKYQAKDFERVYRKLLCNEPLEARYNDHPLINRRPERDLHIKPDWLLIYKYDGEYVDFINTGTHSDLFK